ncbi:LysE family transporter [Candidatus Woesearchaeota archaeon]|nr:LysE family transporter [Candidatus Woesearchaeota archaeon]
MPTNLFYYLITGILLGLNAGISPGPLFTLVISETLQHNLKEGIKAATAPLFTDGPVILIGLLVVSRFSSFDNIIGIISILGFIFLSYYAYKGVTIKKIEIKSKKSGSGSFKKGIITNFLNPSIYTFHLTITIPLILKTDIMNAGLFIAGFMVTLVVSKIILAVTASKSKKLLTGKYYIYTVRILGVILLIFALAILRNGLKLLKVI